MSRPFSWCYENDCMDFAVEFWYRKYETENVCGRSLYRKTRKEIYDGRKERRNCSN